MRALETIEGLAQFEGRGPGTDAERRAARQLVADLTRAGHRTATETFWCRPNWALAHAWHIALALGGSLVSVSHPAIGVVVLAAALTSIVADELTGFSPGRRLTAERASQDVVVEPQRDDTTNTRLIVTANYDAGRTALVYRDALRRPAAHLRRAAGRLALGWLAWLSLAVIWLLAVAVIRIVSHAHSTALGAIQLPPSVALVLALALLLEAAAAGYGPAANDNASGAAVAIGLTDTLRANPPRNLAVELVLKGAGEAQQIGIGRRLRRREDAIVLGIGPCGAGQPGWWHSDGRLVPIRYTAQLRALADAIAPDLAQAHRGRGSTPALPARLKGVPSIAIGNVDRLGLAQRSHQPTDTPDRLDPGALDRAIDFGLRLVHAIDAALVPDPEAETSDEAATPA